MVEISKLIVLTVWIKSSYWYINMYICSRITKYICSRCPCITRENGYKHSYHQKNQWKSFTSWFLFRIRAERAVCDNKFPLESKRTWSFSRFVSFSGEVSGLLEQIWLQEARLFIPPTVMSILVVSTFSACQTDDIQLDER